MFPGIDCSISCSAFPIGNTYGNHDDHHEMLGKRRDGRRRLYHSYLEFLSIHAVMMYKGRRQELWRCSDRVRVVNAQISFLSEDQITRNQWPY